MTQYFVVYNTADLIVRASGACPDGMTTAQAGLAGTEAKQIGTYHRPEELEVRNEAGEIVVCVKGTGERIDI